MKAIHRTTMHARCPNGGWDYYEVAVEARSIVMVEAIEAIVEMVRGSTAFQEEIAEQISDKLGGIKVTLRGRHGTTDTVVEAGK